MLRSCPYCGRIHDAAYVCPQKQTAIDKRQSYRNHHRGKEAPEDRFRHTNRWKVIRDSVYHRDRGLCLCCLAELDGTVNKYNTERLAAHHITPLRENYELRDTRENLLLVCQTHHEMCEDGTIPRTVQTQLAKWSEEGFIDLKEKLDEWSLMGEAAG